MCRTDFVACCAVVTNVIPYIIALSALPVMMWAASVPAATYRRNAVVIFSGDALQHLRPLRFGQGCGVGRHDSYSNCLHHLGLHCTALCIADRGRKYAHEGSIVQRSHC